VSQFKISLRTGAILAFALTTAVAGSWLSSNQAEARRLFYTTITAKDCVYAGQLYSWNACHGGQRCARGSNDFYYWEDDASCLQVSPGPGGRPQI